jgi:hypothetical protein
MPAFAGMTGEGAGGGSRPFIGEFNRMEFSKSFCGAFFKKRPLGFKY